MRQKILLFTLFMCSYMLYGQTVPKNEYNYAIRELNVVYVDSISKRIIVPANNADKGRVQLYFDDGSFYNSRPTRVPFSVSLDELQAIEEEEGLTLNVNKMGGGLIPIANIVKETNPPVGYNPSHTAQFRREANYTVLEIYCLPITHIPPVSDSVVMKYDIRNWVYHDTWEVSVLPAIHIGKWISEDLGELQYKGVRIGEYYWMNKNFSHREPFRWYYWSTASGDEDDRLQPPIEDNRLTQGHLDKYLDQLEMYKADFQVESMDAFINDYGRHYSWYSWRYMQNWAEREEYNPITKKWTKDEKGAWGLPYIRDFRQLMGMIPFNSIQGAHTNLNELDVRFSLSPSYGKNEMNKYEVGGKHGRVYWFDHSNDIFDFNLMPTGARLNGNGPWHTELGKTPTKFDGLKGDIYHLFYTAKFPTKNDSDPEGKARADYNLRQAFNESNCLGNQFNLHDNVDTDIIPASGKYPYSYHWQAVRWCRKLTDEELGYKLFIKVEGLNLSDSKMVALAAKNEIPLLKAIRTGSVDATKVNIVKLDLAKAGSIGVDYVELPNGYLRGFYVQHIIEKHQYPKTVAQVAHYASNVDDEALGYRTYAMSRAVVEPMEVKQVALYPNPASHSVNVAVERIGMVKSITMFNSLTGTQVLHDKNVGTTLDVSRLADGIYIVNAELEDGTIEQHKLIIKK